MCVPSGSTVGKHTGSVEHRHLQAAGDPVCAFHKVVRRLGSRGGVGKGLLEEIQPNGKIPVLDLREFLMRSLNSRTKCNTPDLI